MSGTLSNVAAAAMFVVYFRQQMQCGNFYEYVLFVGNVVRTMAAMNVEEVQTVTFSQISASNLIKADSRSDTDAMLTFQAGGLQVQTRRIVSHLVLHSRRMATR